MFVRLIVCLLLPAAAVGAPTGYLADYLERADAGAPSILAAERSAEALHAQRDATGQLPEPRITAGVFVVPVETRVGAQRARIGAQQTVPWLGRLSSQRQAASAQSQAARARVADRRSGVRLAVSEAYWSAWQRQQAVEIQRSAVALNQAVASSVRARLATSRATLTDQLQADLAVAKAEDRLLALDAERRARIAQLRAAVGPKMPATPTLSEAPTLRVPAVALTELHRLTDQHPEHAALHQEVAARHASAEAARARGLPDLTVGVEWIVTEAATQAGVADSGKDAVMVSAGLTVPLFQGTYDAQAEAQERQAKALEAHAHAHGDSLRAQVSAAFEAVVDSARQATTYTRTLIPQAEAARASAEGAYAVGRAQLPQLLLAQREVLSLRLAAVTALAAHGTAWARLERAVGAPITTRPYGDAP